MPARSRNLYDPKSDKPFKISRSKLDLFLNCPRCFYLDRKLGIGRPPGFPFNLNSAVDALLKSEFDEYRAAHKPHPLMSAAGLNAIPFSHPKLDEWRDSLRRGIQFHDPVSGFLLTGGVDDVWVLENGELVIVDYKATSKSGAVSLDADWQIGYKRQMEVYQWLFRQNGFSVSPTGYFVYCNGKADVGRFDGVLKFDISLLPYTGDPSWVPGALQDAAKTLNASTAPGAASDCEYCEFVALASGVKA